MFDISLLPDDREELATYGEDKIHHLVQYCRPLLQRSNFDFQVVQEEWSGLKVCISNYFRNFNLKALSKRVFNSYHDWQFCNILMLVEILLMFPLSTAWVFSHGKDQIRLEVLSVCGDIRLLDAGYCPPVSHFCPPPALTIWWNSGPRARHPNFND